MPKLACWSCGRQIYTVAPLEALFAEERRCPRCGAFLRDDRRDAERRLFHRRTNPAHDPGPPKPKPKTKPTGKPTGESGKPTGESGAERRASERRTVRRRGGKTPPPNPGGEGGWID